ncbi:aldehyde dehydrogenase family protein [Roseitranquillus sediminis]|uniref:aldehyde dehydrogenase family protein n=1 Tax=Roseitranquillus sediminis TaxID=2809051 RepID=UPI001D0CA408|nr:aldehyde dehydrogenase family protein [Roseitranquillus sediminis]MBM9593171.1 aldehyde dehydrogenase family protein [Roseitranquillus sediminis]
MDHASCIYVAGEWREASGAPLDVVDPATEAVTARIGTASENDVDAAVAAARAAFDAWAETTPADRADFIEQIVVEYDARVEEMIDAITREMGAPLSFARNVQTKMARERFVMAAKLVRDYAFEEAVGTSLVVREPIGVCAFITPWNWPLNQAASKIAYGLAAGCTVVWKPSEISPLSAVILSEAVDAAGLPRGVFNLVQGDGPGVGAHLASHPDVDMVSFTGSTRGGIAVAKAAADTVKRVHQELGGKSANLILPSAEFEAAVAAGTKLCYRNTGQSCQAPTRMLVERHRMGEAAAIAKAAAEEMKTGDPRQQGTDLGPLVSKAQWEKVQALIASGIEEGATLVTGGTGKPEGLENGYYVKPTVFSNVTNDMTIAREEIFGPVICLMGYDDEDDAVRIANDSVYGLATYVSGTDPEALRRVSRKIRVGRVYLNYAPAQGDVPFGGYKQSGNGREQGVHGLEDFTELKAILGHQAA